MLLNSEVILSPTESPMNNIGPTTVDVAVEPYMGVVSYHGERRSNPDLKSHPLTLTTPAVPEMVTLVA